MKHRLLYLPISILILLSFADCAKKGTPSGGKKDTIPPVLVRTVPENYSTNFTNTEIRIYFDEYIKLKNLQTNLIISPPLKYSPIISPQTTSKYIKIKILDTLVENTTYSINFGQSIVDNNEDNPFEYFKYVFSTGSYIDSLTLSGRIKDALLLKHEVPTIALLYPVNESFTDSIVFSEKPLYIASTKDSTGTFEFTNLKDGKYLLLALNEKISNYTYQPQQEKIAFVDSLISLPTSNTYNLALFKEDPVYKIEKPKHESKTHIIFGYQGDISDLDLQLKTAVPEAFESKIIRDIKSDTLHYWFKPALERDSLLFVATHNTRIDSLNIRMRDLYQDSLTVTAIKVGVVIPRDTLKISANTPLVNIDSEKIKIMNSDSLLIPATATLDTKFNVANIVFPKADEQSYNVMLLPGALQDFYETKNDTLLFNLRTKAVSDYGTVSFSLKNVNNRKLIVQLVNNKFEIVAEQALGDNNSVYFDYITPAFYYLRIIFDENANGKWDSGNFLERIQPEKIIYYPSRLEILANWSLNENFTLD